MATLIEAYAAAKAGKVIHHDGSEAHLDTDNTGDVQELVWHDSSNLTVWGGILTGWTIEEPQPKYEDCEVEVDMCERLCYQREGKSERFLHSAVSDPDFIGYVYEGVDELWSAPVLYVSGKHSQTYMYKESDDFEPVRPTHVRFKRG
jgi:hypothetical protein